MGVDVVLVNMVIVVVDDSVNMVKVFCLVVEVGLLVC